MWVEFYRRNDSGQGRITVYRGMAAGRNRIEIHLQRRLKKSMYRYLVHLFRNFRSFLLGVVQNSTDSGSGVPCP